MLFEEKLELLAALLTEQPVTWSGTTRAPLTDQRVYPTTADGIRAWVGVGGSPESVVRTARYGFGLFLAIIGARRTGSRPTRICSPARSTSSDCPANRSRCTPRARRGDRRAGPRTGPRRLAADAPPYGGRAGWPPPAPGDFEREVETGSLYLGSPETVARRIAATVRTLGVDRFDLKYDQPVTHADLMESITLYGEKVVPMVKDMLSDD